MASTIDERFDRTCFLVEASGYERLMLWKEFGKGNDDLPWHHGDGVSLTLGKLANMPVCITALWDSIGGKLVCFWEATSVVVDHRMIEKFFDENCNPMWDGGTRRARTDAMNFHHVLDAIKQGAN